MATVAQDGYKIVLAMPQVQATSYFQPISNRLIAEGIFASTIRSGWGASSPQGGSEILLEIEFTVDKNSKTDAQIQTLANDIAAITSTALRQIISTLVNRLCPSLPPPTVNGGHSVAGTDISGKISVLPTGPDPVSIVLTFGTPYVSPPVVVSSWTTNESTMKITATTTSITFEPGAPKKLQGKSIDYLCA